jgi:dihydroorotate dehydrogenase
VWRHVDPSGQGTAGNENIVMPDWSYQTVLRPVLFRLSPAKARDLSLGVMGLLGRTRLGTAIIDFLGHMRPDPRLARSLMGVSVPTAVGLGTGIDIDARALHALARFGIGFLEVGPVTLGAVPSPPEVQRFPKQQALWYPDPFPNPGLEAMVQRLSDLGALPVPLLVRLGSRPGTSPDNVNTECRQMVSQLGPFAQLFTLGTARIAIREGWEPARWRDHLQAVFQSAQMLSPPRDLLLGLPPDLDPGTTDALVGPALETGIRGVVIDGAIGTNPPGYQSGLPARDAALGQVRHLRQRWGDRLFIVGAGGIHEPADALEFLQAGANLIQVDSGLVFAGPGLPKRINDVLLAAATSDPKPKPQADSSSPSAPAMAWFWTLLLGLAMLIGGLLALAIAATRVVLPYDEGFVGMTPVQLTAINERLLAFMAHDRVSLAGTMIAIGVLYTMLSLFGIRRGYHWARVTVLSSAFTGFGSFFLFLGFGYFEPFHAFVTAILFQFLLLGLHSGMPVPDPPVFPNLRGDWRWRLSLWGQLLFLVHGAGLIGAGVIISTIGSTTVFVPEDLEFMRTTAQALTEANPRLVPLVAHDRASFGGMLIASGLAWLLPALWGFRQGERWLWWAFLAAGVPAYLAAIGVHFEVGYTNLWHLTPAFAGLTVFVLGLVLSYPYLGQKDPAHIAAWGRYRT